MEDNIDIIYQMKIRFLPVLILLFIFFSCVTVPAPVPAGNEVKTEAGDTVAAGDIHTGADSLEPEANAEAEVESAYRLAADTSEPAPGEVVEAGPLRLLPPLSDSELLSATRGGMPWNMVAVKDGGRPMLIVHDLDKNGYNDALVVAVESSGEGTDEEYTLEELSRSARLFQSGRQYSNFLLLIFYQYSGEVILRYTVPVSKQLVFTGVEQVEIKRGSDFPYALLFSFRTKSGIERELVILSGYGITRFTIRENLSEITLIEDIDEDGYQDIVVHEQGFEEGTGFETFLTWYKWNLREFTVYRTTNIVRNLRQFFLVCSEYLRAGEISDFLEYSLDPRVLSGLRKQGLSDSDILMRIFTLAGEATDINGFFDEGNFYTIVFPEIMETPFSYANRMDFRHQVSVRLGRKGEQSRIFLAELNMQKNPFQNKQFYFSVNKE